MRLSQDNSFEAHLVDIDQLTSDIESVHQMNRGLSMDPCQWKKTTWKQGVYYVRTNRAMITAQYRSVSLTEASRRNGKWRKPSSIRARAGSRSEH